MSGPNLVCVSAGMLASILGCPLESFVIDDDMITVIRRAMKGIDVTDESLSVDVIDDAARNAGHFLGSGQTLALMPSEFIDPKLADRLDPQTWQEQGEADMRARAADLVRDVLPRSFPGHIDRRADQKVRDSFPIRLPAEIVSGTESRWAAREA